MSYEASVRRWKPKHRRDVWENMIELLFQVWIYFTDPALVYTHTHTGAQKHRKNAQFPKKQKKERILSHACTHTLTERLPSSLDSFVKALKPTLHFR